MDMRSLRSRERLNMFDFLRFAIALIPLGIYFLLIATLLYRSRPTLLNAVQDTMLLGMGCVGLAVIGPLELFFPNAAYSVLGEWTWAFLLGLYFFIVLFAALNRSPSWTMYGLDCDSFQSLLNAALSSEEIPYQWLDYVLHVPSLGIVAMIEPANRLGNAVHLTPSGAKQDILGWHRLEKIVLSKEFLPSCHRVRSRASGAQLWTAIGALCIVVSMILIVADMERFQRTVAWLLHD